jgi:hypothetical protein
MVISHSIFLEWSVLQINIAEIIKNSFGGIYYRLKTQHIIINKSDNTLQLTSRQHVSAVKQPSSGPSGTPSRYMEIVHCIGPPIVYSGILTY